MPHFGELSPDKLIALGFVRMATITYTGNGAATQAITGAGFQPKTLIVYRQTGFQSRGFGVKTDQDGLNAIFMDFTTLVVSYAPDMIISLDADGFTVGDGTGITNIFNVLGVTYTCIAWG